MEPEKNEGDPKRLSEGIVEYMRKRSKHEVPHFTVQLKKFIQVREKRTRAAISRRNSEVRRELRSSAGPGKRAGGGGNLNAGHDVNPTDKAVKENKDEEDDERVTRWRSRGGSRGVSRGRSRSGAEPKDRCCRKRCRRMGRPVCCPRRRRCPKRRRSRCPRRRRRSCGRKRRRRSCRRRRRRC